MKGKIFTPSLFSPAIVAIHAPVTRVQEILERNEKMKTLLQNEWIHLLVIDSTLNNLALRFTDKQTWKELFDSKIIEREHHSKLLELVRS